MRASSKRILIGLLALFAGGPVLGQSPAPSPREGDNFATPAGSATQVRTATSPAEALFVEKCSMCHRQKGMGTVILSRRVDPAKAQLEQRDDLTAPLIAGVVRVGAGNMPRITRGEVSDEQLAVITAYLLRKRAP